jgi:hypothetical protein
VLQMDYRANHKTLCHIEIYHDIHNNWVQPFPQEEFKDTKGR